MSYILALDQGTTSSRALVFDHAGHVKGSAQKEFRQIFPQPGWIEHDPREILASQTGVAAQALMQAGVAARDIAAIRCNAVIRALYQRLIAAGKHHYVAITACMRKMLVILNAMLKSNQPWKNPQEV